MTKQLEVGKTYTSENGMEWFCITIDDGIAHMRHAHNPHAIAHTWKLDGTPISLTDEYRIVFERGKLVLTGSLGIGFHSSGEGLAYTHRLTLSTLDGELATGTYTHPDGHRIKVEKAND